MRAVHFIGYALCCISMATTGLAAERAVPSIITLDMDDPKCTTRSAGDTEIQLQKAKFISTLDKQMIGIKRWDVFMASRRWKHDVPMNKQMTPKESVAFEKLRLETEIGLFDTLYEDKRSRDLRVLTAGARVANQISANGEAPKTPESDEFVIGAILVGGRETFRLKDDAAEAMLKRSGRCTFENALISQALSVGKSLPKSDRISSAFATLERLAEKYGKPLNAETFQPTDKAMFSDAAQIVQQLQAKLRYIDDLMLLARLESTSKLQRGVRAQSGIEAPGKIDHINVVWNRWRQEGRISDDQEQLSRVLNYMDEKLPGVFMQTAQSKGKAVAPAK